MHEDKQLSQCLPRISRRGISPTPPPPSSGDWLAAPPYWRMSASCGGNGDAITAQYRSWGGNVEEQSAETRVVGVVREGGPWFRLIAMYVAGDRSSRSAFSIHELRTRVQEQGDG
jgi:hypothetical protein